MDGKRSGGNLDTLVFVLALEGFIPIENPRVLSGVMQTGREVSSPARDSSQVGCTSGIEVCDYFLFLLSALVRRCSRVGGWSEYVKGA